jgi:hypothetical protein
MKKLLSLALVALVAISAQAAFIEWSTVAITFGGTTLKNNTSVAGYLIALDGSSLATYDLVEGFSATSIGTVVESKSGTPKSGKFTGNSDISAYSNGDAFAFLITYNDGTDTYYNLSSTVNVLAGLDPTDSTVAPATWGNFAVNGAMNETAGTLTAGGGWTKAVAVPEPASAMLALAGVAMLIRRRK